MFQKESNILINQYYNRMIDILNKFQTEADIEKDK